MLKTLIKDVKQFKKLSHQKQMLIVFLILLLFGTSIVVGAFLSRGSAPSPGATDEKKSITEEIEREPSTTLTISPSTHTMGIGEIVDLEILLSEIPVVSADIILTYDPEVLEVISLANGTVFPKQITVKDEKEIDPEAGKVNYHGSVAGVTDAMENAIEGTVFTISVRALAESASSTIGFDLERTKTALGGNNTLGLTVGSVIEVK